jgi:hypothetical protein
MNDTIQIGAKVLRVASPFYDGTEEGEIVRVESERIRVRWLNVFTAGRGYGTREGWMQRKAQNKRWRLAGPETEA